MKRIYVKRGRSRGKSGKTKDTDITWVRAYSERKTTEAALNHCAHIYIYIHICAPIATGEGTGGASFVRNNEKDSISLWLAPPSRLQFERQ